jgi:hypothetical protein
VSFTNLFSVPLFGLGLLMEAFFPPARGNLSPWTGLVAFGGIFYMMSMAIWSSFFILAYVKSK